MRNQTLVVIVSAVLLLTAACATERSERKTAAQLVGHVSHIQKDLSSMADSRTNIAVARNRTSERLLRSAVTTETENRKRLDHAPDARLIQKLIDDSKARLEAQRKSEAEIAAAEVLSKSAQSRIDPRTDKLAAVAKLLGSLSEKPKWADQLKFYAGFFNEVKKSLDEMQQQTAKNEAAATAQATETATDATELAKGSTQ